MYIELEYPYDLGQKLYQITQNGKIEEFVVVRYSIKYKEGLNLGIMLHEVNVGVIPIKYLEKYKENTSYPIDSYYGKFYSVDSIEKHFFTNKKAIVKKLMEEL